VLQGFNDFATACPELALEWDIERNEALAPQKITKNHSKKVWWTCSIGHSYQSTPANRASNGTGCPICAGKTVLAGFNDLRSRRPEIASQWNFAKNGSLLPDEISWCSGRSVWWKCPLGHEFDSKVSSLTTASRKGGCPVCLNQRIYAGVNDLCTTHPQLAGEWNMEKNVGKLPIGMMSISLRLNKSFFPTHTHHLHTPTISM
jgi:hypothetical protein